MIDLLWDITMSPPHMLGMLEGLPSNDLNAYLEALLALLMWNQKSKMKILVSTINHYYVDP